MSALKCQCGKMLTDEDVCPMPRGVPCRGQRCPPLARREPQRMPWESEPVEEQFPWS